MGYLARISYLVRTQITRLLRNAHATYVDLRLFAAGKADPRLPPMRLRFVGSGDFVEIGCEMLAVLVTYGNLPRHARILEIGCGVGRVALPLTTYLGADATYDGFDVVRKAVAWCRKRITNEHPNFRFHHVTVRNTLYRFTGTSAATFRFPFPDHSFDFVFAVSLFTHLTLQEVKNYLLESHRVLSSDGHFLATFFLLNSGSNRLLPSNDRDFRFPFIDGPMRFASDKNRAVATAIDEGVLRGLIQDAGFGIERVVHGKWAGNASSLTFQDVVVCRKRPHTP
jgi:SAM-dependent methyltransferase